MEKENDDIEYDVNSDSWQIYSLIYKNNIGSIVDKDVKTNNGRKSVTKSFEYNGKKSKEISFSGETDFNFSDKKVFGYGKSRFKQFSKFLTEAEQDTQKEYLVLLKRCCKDFYHSQVNISLMPQTGNLQNVKQGVGNDRLDVFVWGLDEYYMQRSNIIFNHCSSENMEYIRSYLDIFETIYEYCEAVYHIDKTLTKKLIISGRKAIDSAERVIEYIELATNFWEQKKKYIDTCLQTK